MSKKTKEEEVQWEDFPKYTEAELDEFAAWLERFRVRQTVVVERRVREEKMMPHPILKESVVVNGHLVPMPLMELRETRSVDRTPRDISFVDEREAAVAFGAMRKGTHLGHPHYFVLMQQTEKSTGQRGARWAFPSRYDTFQDKLGQLRALRTRRGKVEEKTVEGLEELARGMGV